MRLRLRPPVGRRKQSTRPAKASFAQHQKDTGPAKAEQHLSHSANEGNLHCSLHKASLKLLTRRSNTAFGDELAFVKKDRNNEAEEGVSKAICEIKTT